MVYIKFNIILICPWPYCLLPMYCQVSTCVVGVWWEMATYTLRLVFFFVGVHLECDSSCHYIGCWTLQVFISITEICHCIKSPANMHPTHGNVPVTCGQFMWSLHFIWTLPHVSHYCRDKHKHYPPINMCRFYTRWAYWRHLRSWLRTTW